MNKLFCVVDIELTDDKEIIQFSATKLDENFREISSINYYIQPKKQVSTFVTELTGISNEMLHDKPFFEDVAHELGIPYKAKLSLDTVELSRLFLPSQTSYRLSDLSNSLGLYTGDQYHNAAIDVKVTVKLLKEIARKISKINTDNYKKIENLLEKIDLSMYKFARFCRNKAKSIKFNSEEFINYQGVDFRKVVYDNRKTSDNDKFIIFSSIDEDDYVSKFKITDFVILKKKSS